VTKTPAKANVECPHCGFKQMEYAAAKSTLCRQCGRSFAPNAPKPGLKLSSKSAVAAPDPSSPLRKFEGLWKGRGTRLIACFECKRKHEVSEAATSTNCPGCSAHIDLRDYKIVTSFSRSIRTRGDVFLSSKGDLSSTSVVCRSALIEGKLRGNLQCDETITINFAGKIPGRLAAKQITVEKKSDVQCFRRVTVNTIEIKGTMSAEIVATGAVTIHKTGTLEGSVTAKSIAIEKGGLFSGQLAIGQAGLTQGELLPAEAAGAARGAESNVPLAAHPLPAT
jgi:cytoskeletal protein CcmA (bactofilin family)/DNA-directed RNA polymerase subunit RPC12/RpoP